MTAPGVVGPCPRCGTMMVDGVDTTHPTMTITIYCPDCDYMAYEGADE